MPTLLEKTFNSIFCNTSYKNNSKTNKKNLTIPQLLSDFDTPERKAAMLKH